jgi:hypothetical protein
MIISRNGFSRVPSYHVDDDFLTTSKIKRKEKETKPNQNSYAKTVIDQSESTAEAEVKS